MYVLVPELVSNRTHTHILNIQHTLKYSFCFTPLDVFGCTEDPSLYFIDEHYIKCIDLEASNQTYVSLTTLKSDVVQGGAIDIHHRGRMIYWSDNALWTINRMSLDTGVSEVNYFRPFNAQSVHRKQ